MMSEVSGPWTGVPWPQAEWSRMFDVLSGEDGVEGDVGTTDLQIFADASGMQVKARIGGAMVFGQSYHLTDDNHVVAIANGDSSHARIDRVVLRHDATAKTLLLHVIQGTPAGTPVAPALTSYPGDATQDLPLATVDVAQSLSTSIAAVAVHEDRRYLGLRSISCTTSTRPLNPRIGQPIFETDTGLTAHWDGAFWFYTWDDTDWLAATAHTPAQYILAPGWSVSARRLNGVVYVRGAIQVASAALATNIMCQIPNGVRPAIAQYYATNVSKFGQSVGVFVDIDGTLYVDNAGGYRTQPAALTLHDVIPVSGSFPIN